MKTIKTATLAALIIAATLTFTACSGEQPNTTPPPAPTAAPTPTEAPAPTPTPVVQKFGTPDSTFMETIVEAGVMLPGIPAREVLDESDFNNWVDDGVEVWNAETCGEVTLVHSGGEIALTCEGGRFFLKD